MSTDCAALGEQIRDLRAELAALRAQLPHTYGSGRSSLLSDIADDVAQLKELETEALGCVSEAMLAVTIPAQEQTEWCWVAVGTGIANYYDHAIHAQCVVVTEVFTAIHTNQVTPNCCAPEFASVDPCNGESGVDQALDHLKHWNGDDLPLTWDRTRAELDAARPIAAEVQFATGETHFVAITGYSDDETTGIRRLFIQDPGGPTTQTAWYGFEEFTGAYRQTGKWIATGLSKP